ncbi:hypothetical protein ACFYOY_13380 [Streptomyces sp. NPDC007875]|uniref:hypothetical protein n=1 Tax=Streptomyces sp. NPDC007875 TaxID=3364783 RepID=UPI00367F7981
MPEPKYVLTVTSRTGKKVNQITGASSDSITVYGDTDLQRRLNAAENDPRDLDVTYRRIA